MNISGIKHSKIVRAVAAGVIMFFVTLVIFPFLVYLFGGEDWYPPWSWLVLATVGGVATSIAALASRPTKTRTRTCPYCREEIDARAVVCKHCGRDLP